MSNDNVWCVLPWIHQCVRTDNSLKPCCRYQNPKDDTRIDITLDQLAQRGINVMNDANMTLLRNNMLNGIKSPGCTKCYDQEGDGTASSMRTYINERFLHIKKENCTDQFEKLRYIEMSIDNICNLQCKMCDSKFSTRLMNRDAFLGEEVFKKLEPNFRKFDNIDLSNLEAVKILGGEPFMTPNFVKFIDYLINRADPANITIEIATNGTVIPTYNVIEKLNKFKLLAIRVSLDAYDTSNDYQRYGSSYIDVVNNTKMFETIFKNATMSFHTVVSLLTANTLANTVNVLTKQLNYTMSVDFVRYPFHLSLLNAPDDYKTWILKQNESNEMAYKLISTFLNVSSYNETHWTDFLHYTQKLDKYYNTKLEDYNIELYNFLKSHTN